MSRYENLKKQTVAKVQEILDCSERAGKIEIHIDLEVGQIPTIDYAITNYHLQAEVDEV